MLPVRCVGGDWACGLDDQSVFLKRPRAYHQEAQPTDAAFLVWSHWVLPLRTHSVEPIEPLLCRAVTGSGSNGQPDIRQHVPGACEVLSCVNMLGFWRSQGGGYVSRTIVARTLAFSGGHHILVPPACALYVRVVHSLFHEVPFTTVTCIDTPSPALKCPVSPVDNMRRRHFASSSTLIGFLV